MAGTSAMDRPDEIVALLRPSQQMPRLISGQPWHIGQEQERLTIDRA